MIILGPSGPYFSAPMKILIEEKYTRATPGGVGFAKNGGNYGGSLYPVALAQEKVDMIKYCGPMLLNINM